MVCLVNVASMFYFNRCYISLLALAPALHVLFEPVSACCSRTLRALLLLRRRRILIWLLMGKGLLSLLRRLWLVRRWGELLLLIEMARRWLMLKIRS